MPQGACPVCGAAFDPLRARATTVVGTRVIAYCSTACKERAAIPSLATAAPSSPPPPSTRRRWQLVAAASGLAVLAVVLLGVRVRFEGPPATAAPEPPPTIKAAVPAVPPEPRPEDVPFGPELPPPDFFQEGDAWFHPLAGPVRRLPERPSRRFGAERDHDSPESCRQGHCGVDIGEVPGEAVLAIHDGVVERVVRDAGANGGRYVRLLHRTGSVVSQYFHLDEVSDLKPGQRVRAGDILGTVGQTGIRQSGPHLHFTVAVRGSDGSDRYIDPEPLLTLWPLHIR